MIRNCPQDPGVGAHCYILVPSAAHLIELPGKIGLDRKAYFIVQGIYAGWALFGVPIFAAIGRSVLMTKNRRSVSHPHVKLKPSPELEGASRGRGVG